MRVKPIKGNRKAWDDQQYNEVYDVYMLFLRHQRAETAYTKAGLVRERAERLDRSKGSIEALMMNISAVHVDLLGIDYVQGYKPLANYSHKLAAYICRVNGVDYEK